MSSGRVTVGHPVDVGSGAVFTFSHDFRIAGAFELLWRRHYSTVVESNSWLGRKWTLPYFTYLERRPGEYVLNGAHGEKVLFNSPDSLTVGSCIPNLSANMELWREDNTYSVLHWHDGGDIRRFSFSANAANDRHLLSSIGNLAGHKIRVEYDRTSRPVSLVQELEQRAFEIAYNSANLISAISYRGQIQKRLLVQYDYDLNGRLVAATNALGHQTIYEYDSKDRMTAETSPSGSRFVFKYDRLDRCIYTAGEDGYLEKQLQYSRLPPMTKVIDSRGAITKYFLNAAGQVTQIIKPLGAVITNTFDQQGRLISVAHPDGSKETRSYDDRGNLAESSDACGNKISFQHNNLHVRTKIIDRNGFAWRPPNKFEGSIADVQDLPDRLWQYEWDAQGLASQARSLGAWTIQIRRDAKFRRQERWDEISLLQLKEFDELGRVTQVSDSAGVISSSTYDDLNRLVEVRRGTLSATRYEWNSIGKISGRFGPGDQADTWEYDRYGNVLAHRDALGQAVRYEYDREGSLTVIRNRLGERLEYKRDLQGRIIEEKLFDGRIQKYEYDLLDRRTRIHLSDGRTVSQTFNQVGRLLCRSASDGLVDQYEYDKEGEVVKAWNAHACVELTRDRFARIVKEIQNGRQVRYRYDLDGNRIARHLPFPAAGSVIISNFDVRGRISTLTDELGDCQRFVWDTIDRLLERRCPGDLVERFVYDRERHVHEHRVDSRNESYIATHSYDANGNLAALDKTKDGTIAFSYDPLNRLCEVRRAGALLETYEYDHNDGIEKTHRGERVLAPGGRVLQDGSREISYGADGAIARIRSADDSWSLKHDVNGRLVEAIRSDESRIRYQYDPFGRRTAKIFDKERIEFLWEWLGLAAEIRNGQADAIHFCIDLRPFALWKNGRRFSPILDRRGAVQDVFDELSQRTWQCVLDSYGNCLSESGSAFSPFRLRGQYHDTETGFHYNFHRYYDPILGDYTASDPIGIAGGPHFYRYPRNPLRWDDPFGLVCPEHEEEEAKNKSTKPPGKPEEEEAPSAFPDLKRGGDNSDAHADRAVEALNNAKPPLPKNRSVTAIEHEDGTVSVGLSGNDPKRAAAADQVVKDLNAKYPSDPPTYKTTGAVDPAGLNDPGSPTNPSPLPGTCSEPHAAQAAGENPSPPKSYQSVWTGPKDCPPEHQLPDRPTTPGGNEQMQPCKTCQSNAGNYSDTSTKGSAPQAGETPPTPEGSQ